MKRVIIPLLVGVMMMAGGLVQAGEDTLFPRQKVPVETIEIIDTLDAVTLRAAGTLSDSCDTLMWKWAWSNDALFIDLYREIRPEVTCAAVETPYEFVVPIESLIAEHFADPAQFVLVVNDNMLRVNWTSADELPYTLGLSRGTVHVETASRTANGIQLNGQMGCGYLVSRVVKDWTQPEASVYHVEAFLAIDPAMMCIAGFVPFDVTVPTDAPIESFYTVNGFVMPQEFALGGQSYLIMDLMVTGVSWIMLESFPTQVALTVSGTTDGCDFPAQLVFEPILEGLPYITARVARVAPLAIACPAVLVEYEVRGSLPLTTPGEYTLLINGAESGSVQLP